MPTANRKVLLLGWDDMLRLTEPASPPPATLTRTFTAHQQVAVILPHLPADGAFAHAHVTGLGDLTLHQLEEATGGPLVRPAGEWEAPAAPYLGASPDADASELAPDFDLSPAEHQRVQLNQDAFAAEAAEPDVAEASDQQEGQTSSAPAEPLATPAPSAPRLPTSHDRATLAEALEALQQPPTDSADLNFRIIQYARFATRLATQEDFEVIYAAEWPAWLAGVEIRQLTGRPLVLHLHSLATDRDSAADRGWILELERLAIRRADLVLATSEAVAQRLTALYDLPTDRLRVVASQDEEALYSALQKVA